MPVPKTMPFGTQIYRNVPSEGLTELSARLIDGIPNVARNVMKRPGIAAWADTSNANKSIDLIAYWPNNKVAIVVCNGNIYSVTSAGAVTLRATGKLQVGARVDYIDVGDTLYLANGGRIVKLTAAYASSYIAITGVADPHVNSLEVVNQKGIATLTGSQRCYFTPAGSFDTYNGLTDSFTATVNPDAATKLVRTKTGVMVFGPKSIEPRYDRGTSSLNFLRDNGGVLSTGCIAPNTVQYINDIFYYLDQYRRIVRWTGGGIPEVLSTPFDDVIQGFALVSNAISDVYRIWGLTLYVISFPTAASTLVYCIETNEWCEWAYWNGTTAAYENYLGNYYCYIPEWNKHLVGGKKNGKVGLMSKSTYQDWGDTMRTLYRSGHINYGSYMLEKQSDLVRLHLKKGVGSYTAAAKSVVRYRDNNEAWGNEIELDLGFTGEQEFFIDINSNGTYCTRQYEFVHTANSEFILFGGEELISGGM